MHCTFDYNSFALGAKLAVLDTPAKVKFIGSLMTDSEYWLGAECVGCTLVTEDKWQWSSGKKLSVKDPQWVKESNKQSPHDDGTHDAFYLALERTKATKNILGFTNYNNHYYDHKYVCELP